MLKIETSGFASNRRSMSEVGPSSSRATEPKTRMFTSPSSAQIARTFSRWRA